jgi:DNA-binding GntR family transcriptional regulator
LTLDQRRETIVGVTLAASPATGRRRHPTMAETALAELQDSIFAGVLPPGSPLRLEELAERLGMSISPVREAVRRLETLGLAVHVPNRGARVSCEHDRILEACVARDPDRAAAELTRHLSETANVVARQMGADDLFEP